MPFGMMISRERAHRALEAMFVDQWAAGAALRWTRAAVLAACGVVTGSLFHVAADGQLPGTLGLVALWLISMTLAGPLLGAEVGTGRVVALLVLWQAGLHVALSGIAGHGAGAHGVPLEGTRAEAWGHPTTMGLGDLPGALHMLGEVVGTHAPMALGHAVAAAVVGLWLAAGERAVWTLLALSQRRLTFAVAELLGGWWWLPSTVALPLGLSSTRVGMDVPLDRLQAWLLVRGLGRRGPPLSC
jgi:hypothetical protein